MRKTFKNLPKVITGITILILFIITFTHVGDIDDTFYFFVAHYIKDGAVPYKDINIIILPLFHYMNLLFVMFIDSFVAIRITEFLSSILAFFVLKKLFNNFMSTNKACFLGGIFATYLCCMKITYNGFVILFSTLILVLLFGVYDRKEIKNKDIVILSTVGTLGIFTKQTIGGIAFIGMLTCLFILTIELESYRKAFLNVIKAGFVCLFWTILLFIHFYIIGCLPAMFDMCFLGIFTFTKSASDGIFMFATILILINLLCTFCLFKKEKNLKYILFSIMAISNGSIMYPLANGHHVASAFFLTLALAYIFTFSFAKKTKSNLPLIITLPLIAALLQGVMLEHTDETVISSQKYTKGMLIPKQIEDDMNLINNYANKNSGNRYYVITDASAMFFQGKDYFDNYYDLFFDGNIGTNDPVMLIKKIENDYIIIYTNEDDDFFQIPEAALNYIRNLNKVDEIGRYSIYTKNDH